MFINREMYRMDYLSANKLIHFKNTILSQKKSVTKTTYSMSPFIGSSKKKGPNNLRIEISTVIAIGWGGVEVIDQQET